MQLKTINRQEWSKVKRINKHFSYCFYDLVYFCRIYVIWNVNEDQRKVFIKSELKAKDSDFEKHADEWAMSTCSFDKNHIISIRKWKNSSIGIAQLAHECFHVMVDIFKSKGFKFDSENDEAHAYLLQGLVYRCHVALCAVSRASNVKEHLKRKSQSKKLKKSGKKI